MISPISQCLNPECLSQNQSNIKFCVKCGNKLLLGDRYLATEIIGSGGFGRTFLAIDEQKPSKPKCVIKQFFPQAQGTDNAEKAKQLFEQEAVRLDDLGHHDQIPELKAYLTQDHRQYLVQEFIDGQTLAQELRKLPSGFNEAQIRQLLNDLLPVLEFIHGKQVIHRDIKPDNIIRRSRDNKLVLVDFGAAKFATVTALAKTGTTIGTVEYLAPEQNRGKAIFASDLYSLGVTCIHLMTRHSPFDLFDINEDTWVWRQFLGNNPVSDNLGQILDKLIQNAINRRYQSASEVLKVLNLTLANIQITPSNQINRFLIEEYKKLGDSKYDLKDYKGAIDAYTKAIEIDPKDAEAYIKRANTKFTLDDYEGAIDDINHAIEISPNDPELYSQRGIIKLALEDYEEVIPDFTKAIDLGITNPSVFAYRAFNRDMDEDYEGAVNDYNQAIQLDRNNSELFHSRGGVKYNLKDYEGAIKDYTKAIELNPTCYFFYCSLGEAKFELGDYEGAIYAYTKAIEINTSYRFYKDRGDVKRHIKDYVGAIEDYTIAIEKIELDLDGYDLTLMAFVKYSGRGYKEYFFEDYENTITDFNKAIESDSEFSAKFSLRDYEGLIVNLNKVVEICPTYATRAMYTLRGYAEYSLKDYQKAIISFSKVIKLDHENVLIFRLRGYARNLVKDYQGAIADFTKAIELNPIDAALYKNRGKAKYSLGDFQGATDDFNKALEIEIDSELKIRVDLLKDKELEY